MTDIDGREAVAVASDHAGYELKEVIKPTLVELGYAVQDLGTHGPESVDYPAYGKTMADAIARGEVSRGVLVCGTGIGISIAANRNPAVRAVVCHNVFTARLARQHNDGNVLALGARVIDAETARACVRVFFRTAFEGGRHARRVDMLG
ncbi:MAG: ribose 5-phosphate isomerase B [Rhodospirillaceae bacterium]|nr:ribose 5-phosphate isomerase B [Rhodospirillaceae bacterium]|tara:strand:- start:1678 stop:2124 length:447 start_codon:yes stop_codon:yes gene_type:complete